MLSVDVDSNEFKLTVPFGAWHDDHDSIAKRPGHGHSVFISSGRSFKSALGTAVSGIAALGSKAPKGSEFIIYYTGCSSDGNWILPSANQSCEVVTPADVLGWLAYQQMPVTIVSDCCNSGKWCNVPTDQPQSSLKASKRIIAASHGRSYIGELLSQFATATVSTKQRPSQKLIQYSHDSVLPFAVDSC